MPFYPPNPGTFSLPRVRQQNEPTQPPSGPPTERATLSLMQSDLADARQEYALRRYQSAEDRLKAIDCSVGDVRALDVSPERIFLVASTLCLRGRIRERLDTQAVQEAQELFKSSAALFKANEGAIARQIFQRRDQGEIPQRGRSLTEAGARTA